jgi:hypothetical protein
VFLRSPFPKPPLDPSSLSLSHTGRARQGRSKGQRENGFGLVIFGNSRGCEFEAVVKPNGVYWLAGVQDVALAELQTSAAGLAVIATIPGDRLHFSVARAEEGGACTGYTLTNKKLKKLGFRVVKWKHVTPGPDDKDAAAKHEDAIAWIDMLEEKDDEEEEDEEEEEEEEEKD